MPRSLELAQCARQVDAIAIANTESIGAYPSDFIGYAALAGICGQPAGISLSPWICISMCSSARMSVVDATDALGETLVPMPPTQICCFVSLHAHGAEVSQSIILELARCTPISFPPQPFRQRNLRFVHFLSLL